MNKTASKETKELPQLEIGDSSVDGSGWKWQDGWQGLIPSISTIEDAINILGSVTGKSELANGVTYDFLNGYVRITVRTDSLAIAKIWIDKSAGEPYTSPQTVEEAVALFGKLVTTGVNRQEGAILERPGMRICADCMNESNPIRWLEVYRASD